MRENYGLQIWFAFIEKPVAVDSPGVRSVIESGELAAKSNLGILAGTQRRHALG